MTSVFKDVTLTRSGRMVADTSVVKNQCIVNVVKKVYEQLAHQSFDMSSFWGNFSCGGEGLAFWV